MHSPFIAIGWQLWARYRLWLMGWLAYVVLAALLCRLLTHEGLRHALALPVVLSPLFLMGLFTLGSDGDLASRDSVFPARMLTLPITTRALVGWPMLYGVVLMPSVCLAMILLVLRPAGVPVPLSWPPVVATTCLVWFQAILWSPFPLPLIRLPLLVVVVVLQGGLVALGQHFNASSSVIIGIVVVQVPFVYWRAVVRVSQARRGDGPYRHWLPARMRQLAKQVVEPSRRPFRSALSAQIWLELRLNGWTFPLLVAIFAPIVALVVLSNQPNTLGSRNYILNSPLSLLFLPPVFALFGCSQFGRYAAAYPDREPSAFLAVRPLSTAGVVRAKLMAAAVSVLAGVGVATLAFLLTVPFTTFSLQVSEWRTNLPPNVSGVKLTVAALVMVCLLLAGVWRISVTNLCVTLAGRPWLTGLVGIVFFFLFQSGFFLFLWTQTYPELLAALRLAGPSFVSALAVIKVLLAITILVQLRRLRLVSASVVGGLVAVWFIVTIGLIGLAIWFIPRGMLAWHVLVPAVVLAVPCASLALMPLSLAWNRHR